MKTSRVLVDNPNFRPHTHTEMREVIFSMFMKDAKTAALGDMIAWLPALRWVAESYNFVRGHVVCPEWFVEIAALALREYPGWRVHTRIPERLGDGTQIRRPFAEPVNATGMHLVDLGFVYFAGVNPPPQDTAVYPYLETDDIEFEVPSKPYAVMTPGTSAVTRKWPAKTYNEVCEHLIKRGITPVHVGASMPGRGIEFSDEYDFGLGINLIEDTTLLEALKLMKHAKMVLGIDNGLLHLAGLTDTTILFGYTIAGPGQRQIVRKHGHLVELYGDKEKLPCLFCQERVRFFLGHHFTNCIYYENTPQCVKALNTQSWTATIDMVLDAKE